MRTLTVEVNEPVWTVASGDTVEHFESFEAASMATRRGGGQIRSSTRTTTVPGAYLVVVDDDVTGVYDKAAEAARAAARVPGAVVKIGPKPLR